MHESNRITTSLLHTNVMVIASSAIVDKIGQDDNDASIYDTWHSILSYMLISIRTNNTFFLHEITYNVLVPSDCSYNICTFRVMNNAHSQTQSHLEFMQGNSQY